MWRQLQRSRCVELRGVVQGGRAASTKVAPVEDVTLEQAKPYTELPGPSKFEFIRGFLPGGRYRGLPVQEMFLDMNRRYGNIFRLPSVANADIIFTMNPKDYETVFRNEGQYPYRRSFDTMKYFKQVHRPEVFGYNDGLISGNGPEWGKMRTSVNPILLQPRNARLYLSNLLQVNDEFIQRIRDIRDPQSLEMPDDFVEEIRRLVLESISSVALNTHLGLLGEQRNNEEVQQLILALQDVVDLGFELDISPPIWKYVKVPKFKKLMRSLDTITDFCYSHSEKALERIEADARAGQLSREPGLETSILEKLAQADRNAAVIVAMDLLMAGTDPTLVSLSGILLCLSKNPAQQARLLAEVREVLPEKNSKLTMDSMGHLPYLRACIKEGIRLYPIGPGTLRRMPHDVVLSGYRVVAGTDVGMAANFQMSHMEKFVPRVGEFLPERWLRDENAVLLSDELTPFMYQPFGLGKRTCAGKRIVDMILEISVAQLVRNFEIGFDYPTEDAFKAQFFVQPNMPFKFKFVERKE